MILLLSSQVVVPRRNVADAKAAGVVGLCAKIASLLQSLAPVVVTRTENGDRRLDYGVAILIGDASRNGALRW